MIKVKRAYEPAAKTDGRRYLVDRLWPRGVKKELLDLTEWVKEVAPSSRLRTWFKHDPAKWGEFQKRYHAELQKAPQTWQSLIKAAGHGRITLVYSAHDAAHNNAVALKSFLEARMKEP